MHYVLVSETCYDSNQFGDRETMEIKERTKIVSSEKSFNTFVLVPADLPPKNWLPISHSVNPHNTALHLFQSFQWLRLRSVRGKTAGVGAG